MTLSALQRRVVVCVGTGGVGKTTVAASLALEAARSGRRAAVVTIDPARRLADALGIRSLGNEPQALPRERLDALGVPAQGSLSALMLDMKRTFDDLVTRLAEDEAARSRVLENPIYRHISDALAGSSEYAAMEKVYELSHSSDFDTLVVDTPPSQHALDFLDAPERLIEFLDSRLVQYIIHPAMAAGRAGFRWFQWGAQRGLSLIERVTGVGFLQDLSEFLLAFEHMSEGFRERAREVRSLLLGPESAFVLVAKPRGRVGEAGTALPRAARGRSGCRWRESSPTACAAGPAAAAHRCFRRPRTPLPASCSGSPGPWPTGHRPASRQSAQPARRCRPARGTLAWCVGTPRHWRPSGAAAASSASFRSWPETSTIWKACCGWERRWPAWWVDRRNRWNRWGPWPARTPAQ